jgi:hypothetical protein
VHETIQTRGEGTKFKDEEVEMKVGVGGWKGECDDGATGRDLLKSSQCVRIWSDCR